MQIHINTSAYLFAGERGQCLLRATLPSRSHAGVGISNANEVFVCVCVCVVGTASLYIMRRAVPTEQAVAWGHTILRGPLRADHLNNQKFSS